MKRWGLVAGLISALACVGAPALAYEPGTTHPGMTTQALLASRLHAFLRRQLGLGLGAFERLQVLGAALGRRELRELRRSFGRLDPSGGYRPDEHDGQRAAAWVLAGSVLAGMPSSVEEHHFYSPVRREGLDDQKPFVTGLLSFLSVFEGGDRIRDWLTGTGFKLEGRSALDLIRSGESAYSVPTFQRELAAAVSSASVPERAHHLTLALVAMGGVLHVLQDLASPTRTRNDYAEGHLQKLGVSLFDRGSAYERGVALAFGQLAVPAYRGAPVTRTHLFDFFTSRRWDGLADRTAAEHFSPGTLPPPVGVLPTSDGRELAGRLSERLPFAKPALAPVDLGCARRRTCYQAGRHGPLLAYRVDSDDRLVFFLDNRCLNASARVLVPLAVGYSTGLIDFLLRGELSLAREGEALVVKSGIALRDGKLRILVEDGRGVRRELSRQAVTAAAGAVIARQPLRLTGDLRRVVALVEGRDGAGEALVATGQLTIAGPTSQGAGFTATDIGASRPTSVPASAPAPVKPPPKKKGLQPPKAPKLEPVPGARPLKR